MLWGVKFDQEEKMKRIAGLLVVLVLSAGLLYSQEGTKEMNGRICYLNCIGQRVSSGQNYCDPNCKNKTGELVLVDDYGVVSHITNQDKVAGYAEKDVKMHCKMMKDKKMKVVDIEEKK